MSQLTTDKENGAAEQSQPTTEGRSQTPCTDLQAVYGRDLSAAFNTINND